MIYNRHSCIAALAAIAVTASCTRDYQAQSEPNPSPDSRNSETEIPVTEAVAALNRILDSTDPVTRGGRRTIARIDRVSAADMFSATTRSEKVPDAGDLLYVVNFAGDEGYAILGADSRLDTVLIVGDKGNFDPLLLGPSQDEPIPLNPGRDSIPSPGFDLDFQIMPGLTADDLYCEEEDEYYIGAIGNVCPVDDLIVDLLVDYTTRLTIWAGNKEEIDSHGGNIINVDPLLKTMWKQEYPFNKQCVISFIRRPAGCTTIATAQILTYIKNRDLKNGFGITNSTWNDLEAFKVNNYTYGNTDEYLSYLLLENDISKFIKKVADGIGVHYDFLGKGGTFALPISVKSYLEDLGYNVNRIIGFDTDTQHKIALSLENNKPVFIGALDKKARKNGGHAWVIDGCKFHFDSSNYFNHCNFGWGGKSDGWYYYKLFNSDNKIIDPYSSNENTDDSESDDSTQENTNNESNDNTFNFTWWFRVLIIK